MKKMMKLVPAFIMLLVSAILVSTASYAWFSMSNQVTATGMKVQATADSGILIKTHAVNFTYTIPANAQTFKATTDVAMSDADAPLLLPVSTINASSWYKNNSDEFDNAKAGQASDTYTAVTDTTGYYAKFNFKIRSSANAVAVDNVKLKIDQFTLTTPQDQTSAALNKAIRVAVVYGSQVYIYAPLEASQSDPNPYFDANGQKNFAPTYSNPNTVTVKKTVGADDVFTLTGNQIPASDTGIDVFVYIYFEGEDPNCKSSNITASLDKLGFEIKFSTISAS